MVSAVLVGAAVSIVLLVVVAVVLYLLCAWGRTKGRTVCLIGLSDAGKTMLYMQLKTGKFFHTQNSMVENVMQYKPSKVENSTPINIVDVPGNERLRERIFSKYKESLRGIVMVIDSVNFPHDVHDVAEVFYDLLSDPTVHQTKAPLLVACNKQDMTLATPKDTIITLLEKEITQLQVSRQAKLSTLDGGPKTKKPVEFIKKGQDFHFSDLPSWMGVRFVDCSALGQGSASSGDASGAEGEKGKEAKIREVQDWIDGLCY